MTIYIPPEGDRFVVQVAEAMRRREQKKTLRAILAARRARGLEARHAAKARGSLGGSQP